MINTHDHNIDTVFNDIQVGFGKNSWYIKKTLASCRNLFEGEDITYQVQAFLCKCGKQYIYITQKNKKRIIYTCSDCDNSHFFNISCYSNKYNDLLVNIDQKAILSIENDTYAYAKLYVNIPIKIDLTVNKVIFQKELVYTLRISLKGGEESHQEKHKLTSDVTQNTYHKLLSYIDKYYLSHKIKDYEELNMYKKTPPQYRKAVKFFLIYKYYYSEFLSWCMTIDINQNGDIQKTTEGFLSNIQSQRNEKFTKKTLYNKYLSDVDQRLFKPFTPNIITHSFKDPNIISGVLRNKDLILTYKKPENIKYLANKI